MYRLSDTVFDQHTPEHDAKTLAVRTYEQIAAALAERGCPAMTPARVAQICRLAELKIARALRADPEIRERWRPAAAHGRQATRPVEHSDNWGRAAVSRELPQPSNPHGRSQP